MIDRRTWYAASELDIVRLVLPLPIRCVEYVVHSSMFLAQHVAMLKHRQSLKGGGLAD